MNIITIVGTGIVAAVLSIILRQYKPEYAASVSLAAGAIILAVIVSSLKPILATLNELTSAVRLGGEFAEVLLKALAICYLVLLATDTCRDAGESAIAVKLEIAGKIAIMLISLPLVQSLVQMITGLMS